MADFQPIPINGTAEQLEKLLGMDIVESITENPTNDQIPTALAVKNAIESGGGGTAEGAVLYTAQNLTPEQQAQARQNIGVNIHYSTTREELAVTLGKEDAVPNDVTSAVVWGLYDALMAKYPDRVQKNEIHNNDGTFTNYEYVISTGEYNAAGHFYGHQMDTNIKKPKYLILSGIHGNERPPIIAVYRFIRDVLEGHNVPAQFREGCVIRVMPVGTPYGLDTLYEGNGNNPWRPNENLVNINQNFDYQWVANEIHVDGLGTITTGTSAESEKETQAIANWLKANANAVAFFDCHIQGVAVNEVVMLMGGENSDNYKTLKKIAMRGMERVIPFWRDAIGYPEETIFYSTETIDKSGLAIGYATEVLKIPSLALEFSAQQASTQDDFEKDTFAITAETVAADAEVIGNILMEVHDQYFTNEVVDVKEVNEKLDGLTESMEMLLNQSANGFRVETGVYTAEADLGYGAITVPCTIGAKVVVFVPDDETFTAITSNPNGTQYLVGAVCEAIIELPFTSLAYRRYGGYLVQMRATPNGSTIMESAGTMTLSDTNSFKFAAQALKAGTYNWTAYYWNE